MSETVTFSGVTKQPLPVGRVLQNEEAASLTEVVVLGWAPDGSFHFAASDADMSRALMLLACAQRWITDQQDLSGASRRPASVPVSASGAVVQLRQQGFTGNTCSNCTCQDCGTTTGCS